MDPPEPPPIHHQIPPLPIRRPSRQKNKGPFIPVSGRGSRTSNYRIRKLAGGRLGGGHTTQSVTPDITERRDSEEAQMGDDGPDVSAHIPEDEQPTRKTKRTKVPNTWAVSTTVSSPSCISELTANLKLL